RRERAARFGFTRSAARQGDHYLVTGTRNYALARMITIRTTGHGVQFLTHNGFRQRLMYAAAYLRVPDHVRGRQWRTRQFVFGSGHFLVVAGQVMRFEHGTS